MNRLVKMILFGTALAALVGYYVLPFAPTWAVWVAGALILAAGWLYGKRPYRNPDGLTRAWARAMVFNGLMSIEELHHFYQTHPEPEPKEEESGN